MKKLIIVVIMILMTQIVSAEWVGLTKSYADTLYCSINGCSLGQTNITGDLYMNGYNIYMEGGEIWNVTLVDATTVNVSYFEDQVRINNFLAVGKSSAPATALDVNGKITVNGGIDFSGGPIKSTSTYVEASNGNGAFRAVNSVNDSRAIHFGQNGGSSQYVRIVPTLNEGTFLFGNDVMFDFDNNRWEHDGINYFTDDTWLFGDVGIGTASPNAQLDIHSDVFFQKWYDTDGTANKRRYSLASGGEDFRLASRNDADDFTRNLMVWKHDGNVGIGTDSPSAKLDIAGGTIGTTAIGGRNINLNQRIQSTSGRSGLVVQVTNEYLEGGDNGGLQFLYPYNTYGGGDGDNHKAIRVSKGTTLEDLFYVNMKGNLNTTGNITAERVKVNNIAHAYGGIMPTIQTISLTQNVWANVTNSSGDLWSGLEIDNMAFADGVLTIQEAGDYIGIVTISVSGGNGDDFEFRIYNLDQDSISGYEIITSTDGVNNYKPVTLPVYLEANANDRFVMQVMNPTDNDDVNIRSAVFEVHYLHS